DAGDEEHLQCDLPHSLYPGVGGQQRVGRDQQDRVQRVEEGMLRVKRIGLAAEDVGVNAVDDFLGIRVEPLAEVETCALIVHVEIHRAGSAHSEHVMEYPGVQPEQHKAEGGDQG